MTDRPYTVATSTPLTVTVSEAMRLTGFGKTTIHDRIKDGTLASAVVCGRRLIDYRDVERLVAAARRGSPQTDANCRAVGGADLGVSAQAAE